MEASDAGHGRVPQEKSRSGELRPVTSVAERDGSEPVGSPSASIDALAKVSPGQYAPACSTSNIEPESCHPHAHGAGTGGAARLPRELPPHSVVLAGIGSSHHACSGQKESRSVYSAGSPNLLDPVADNFANDGAHSGVSSLIDGHAPSVRVAGGVCVPLAISDPVGLVDDEPNISNRSFPRASCRSGEAAPDSDASRPPVPAMFGDTWSRCGGLLEPVPSHFQSVQAGKEACRVSSRVTLLIQSPLIAQRHTTPNLAVSRCLSTRTRRSALFSTSVRPRPP